MQTQPAQTYAFNIDRGGTFTDFYVQDIKDRNIIKETAFKVLSQSQEGQGPVIGIKRYLKQKGLIKQNQAIPARFIEHINLGTTSATNALLERKGCKNAMLLTEGFGDLLVIRHQARPNIFDLKCTKKPSLANEALQISQRIFLHDNKSQGLKERLARDHKIYVKEPTEQQLKQVATKLKESGIASVGISFCNSYISPLNELRVQAFLEKQGFENIEMGSTYQDIGYLKRSETANLDAFLNPMMKKYFKSILKEFQQPDKLTLRIMKSNGGFDTPEKVKASQLLLSGPAGGLIGCKSIISVLEGVSKSEIKNLICVDMGGTSTDISRIEDRSFASKYSLQVEGIELCTPHLQIDTIAAGGGSKLDFYNGMFVVGPESVGANPGPVCYGIGDELALTDANFVLGRLDEVYFPKIFGKNKNEGLNLEASRQAFKNLAQRINKSGEKKSIQQIAEGHIQIANELMAKSARKLLTIGLPDALVIFGSAGGQHCCDLALKMGIKRIFIHKYSGVQSAYGLSKAVETIQNKVFLGLTINKNQFDFNQFSKKIDSLKTKNIQQYSETTYEIGIGYYGTSYTLKVPFNKKIIENFQANHKKENGFSLKTPSLRIQYFVQHLIKQPPKFVLNKVEYEQQKSQKYLKKQKEVYLGGSFKKIPLYDIQNMKNCKINGPALLLTSTSSIVLREHWTARVTHEVSYLFCNESLKKQETVGNEQLSQQDPIKLTLYSTRLMSIAEQMGKTLQNISISTNIRERLDFSCGIFDEKGKLLANAPHLPVHLGSMQTAVIEQINRGIEVGDVILTNHPIAGGSHLPDLTVVTCTEICGTRMFLASRGHHADIGGITPGSMPAFSHFLSEQGVAVEKFKLMENNQFQEEKLRELFKQSRRIDDNVSDLTAQMAANGIGAKLLAKFIDESGIEEFKQYIQFICQNAAESVRNLLCSFSISNNLQQIDTLTNREFMDDGTVIELKLTINRKERNAIFDFTGTGLEVMGNTNAPKSITRSAILYCLRSLIGSDIPLNSGCLIPLTIIIPENTILSPSKDAAVVGGNVQTSQKLVDLILKPFNYVACSYGTMNNFLFGTDKLTYYETICGGSGAGEGFNGVTVQCHMTNTRITDVESIEKTYPVIVKQFKERKGSGGRGKYIGGNGAVREIQFLEDTTVSLLSERRVFSGYGLKGGENGSVGKNTYITLQDVEKNVGGKNTFKVYAGESIRIETPGGGGYGYGV